MAEEVGKNIFPGEFSYKHCFESAQFACPLKLQIFVIQKAGEPRIRVEFCHSSIGAI